MSYVTFQAPDELKKKALTFIQNVVKNAGKIKKGMNEATKNVERKKAKFVVIASDVDPPELVLHLPIICDEENVPYIFVDKKEELGKAAGLTVPTSAIAVVETPRKLESELQDITKKIADLKK
ncbi:MAG: 50S ribosomal protein L7Ae [Promethearchaeota archaeon]